MSFSPLNLYTFAATRGQFLRLDVQALLRTLPVGPYSDFAGPHDRALRREAENLRKQLDALLFGEPSRWVEPERPPLTIVRRRLAGDARRTELRCRENHCVIDPGSGGGPQD